MIFEFVFDFVINYPGISFMIAFAIFAYIFRTTREPYGHGD